MSVKTVHFSQLGLDNGDLFQTLNYHKPPDYVTEFPSTMNIVSEKFSASFLETAIDKDKPVTNSERRLLLWPEKFSVEAMQHMVRKFIRPVAMILLACVGAAATAKVSLIELKHLKDTKRHSEGACVAKFGPFWRRTFARHILNENSIKVDIASVADVARIYLQQCTSPLCGLPRMDWKSSRSVPAV